MSRKKALVHGLAIAGEATARALLARGYDVVAADDRADDAKVAVATALGVDYYEKPNAARIERLVGSVDLVVPSPGVPETHAVIAAARRAGVPLRTEIDLAWQWEQGRAGGPRPVLAITGTDGKTTTTLWAAAMVEASGRHALACGNTELPMITAIDDPSAEVFVVECTSFRLAFVDAFAPTAAVWLNLAPDHLDWHVSMASYGAAKARIWEHQRPADAAIAYAADPIVMEHLAAAPGRHVTFAAEAADYRVERGELVGPSGALGAVGSLYRTFPHDITNGLAAAALVLESGAGTTAGVGAALTSFTGVAHRISFVAEAGGVRWYDDSKATTPHAALAAIRGFERVVLLAGGRNKGLDLAALAEAADRVVGVVAIGESGPDVAAAFDGRCPVTLVGTSMADAVEAAAALATPGDAVLLSPGCASFDWYTGYAARGDDFARLVRERVTPTTTGRSGGGAR